MTAEGGYSVQDAVMLGWCRVSLQPLGDDGWVTVAELGSAEVTGTTRPCSLPHFWPDSPVKHCSGELGIGNRVLPPPKCWWSAVLVEVSRWYRGWWGHRTRLPWPCPLSQSCSPLALTHGWRRRWGRKDALPSPVLPASPAAPLPEPRTAWARPIRDGGAAGCV